MRKKRKMIKSFVAKINSPEVMKPLKDYMTQNKINTSMLGERMGLTRQDVCHILNNDTVKISMLENIAEAMDCNLKLSLSRNGKSFCNTNMTVPSTYRRTDVIPKRLRFFFDAISQSELSYKMVSVALDISCSTVRYWFRTDDTMIRNIKQFADTFGFDFKMSFAPATYGKIPDENGIKLIVRLINAYYGLKLFDI